MPIQQWTADIVKAAKEAGIEPAALLAVVEVETSGAPFEPDGVTPRFLFERHIFFREVRRRAPGLLERAVAEGLAFSSRRDGQYADQRTSAGRKELLARARAMDRVAADRSCSWGLGQVMGFNAESLGFSDVEAMLAVQQGIPGQIDCMVRFIKTNKLAGTLNAGDWAGFASRYNGPAFRKNAYDTKLAAAHARWRDRLPGLDLSAPVSTLGPAPRPAQPIAIQPAAPVPIPVPTGGSAPAPIPAPTIDLDPAAIKAAEALADALARVLRTAAASTGTAQRIDPDPELLERLRKRFDALGGKLGADSAIEPIAAAARKLDPAVLLTPIDKLLGGTSLMGSKSTVAVVGYTLMSVLQSVGVLGTAAGAAATPTGLVLTLLAGGLGGAGLLSKGDRAIKLLGMIAAK